MGVITNAKNLVNYVMQVTQKSPKFYRFSLVAELHEHAIFVLKNVIRANETFVAPGDESALARRQAFQQEAMVELKLLGSFAEIALDQKCVMPKHYETISSLAYECMNMLGAWGKSDRKRFSK